MKYHWTRKSILFNRYAAHPHTTGIGITRSQHPGGFYVRKYDIRITLISGRQISIYRMFGCLACVLVTQSAQTLNYMSQSNTNFELYEPIKYQLWIRWANQINFRQSRKNIKWRKIFWWLEIWIRYMKRIDRNDIFIQYIIQY